MFMKEKIIKISVTLLFGVSLVGFAILEEHRSYAYENASSLSPDKNESSCTGPKKENLAGHIFCHSENAAPCADMYGCK